MLRAIVGFALPIERLEGKWKLGQNRSKADQNGMRDGLAASPDPRDRATLAMASAVRHPGIAMSIAGASFHDPRVSAAVLLFMLVGLVAAAPYTVWIKRSRLNRPAHS